MRAVWAALPAVTASDCYRIIVTGESPEIRAAALYQALSSRFFSRQVRDVTVGPLDVWQRAGENSLEGLFLQILRRQYDAADSPEQKRELEQASYTLLFGGLSLAALTHLTRHRMQALCAPNLLKSARYDRYVLPESVQQTGPVSYTPPTLPTNREGVVSGVGVTLHLKTS